MTTPGRWVDRPLADFVRAAAAPGPVPGSGSGAAALGALGAALASMALARPAGEGDADGPSERLRACMEALLARVDEDVEAYAAFLAARAGRGALEPAVEASFAVRAALADDGLSALGELAGHAAEARPHLASEVVTAAEALLACVRGATFTARSNLRGLADLARRTALAHALDQREARAAALHATVRASLPTIRPPDRA
jgi:formiminotetrahydrofolate cyclodeaminase